MKRPVLRYFGGKYILADWIISYFPEHRIYVEPFGGAGSVLMQKKRSYAEVYNDLDQCVVTLFKVLRDPDQAKELERVLRLTPFARAEFARAHKIDMEPIELSRQMIIRSFMGFGADSVSNMNKATGFRSNSNRSGTTPAHDWVNYPDTIKDFTERLMGVVIENRDFDPIIKTHDSEETLFYVDPPYPKETRKEQHGYKFDFDSMDEHKRLIESLLGCKGMVILSSYANTAYDDIARHYSWTRVDRKAFADGGNERVESLYLNPAAQKQQNQMSLSL